MHISAGLCHLGQWPCVCVLYCVIKDNGHVCACCAVLCRTMAMYVRAVLCHLGQWPYVCMLHCVIQDNGHVCACCTVLYRTMAMYVPVIAYCGQLRKHQNSALYKVHPPMQGRFPSQKGWSRGKRNCFSCIQILL